MTMVNAKDPGIAATVYLVHMLQNVLINGYHKYGTSRAYSEIKAAFPRTVRSTARYSVVPQNQCPVSRPLVCLRSPQKRMIEKPNRIYTNR